MADRKISDLTALTTPASGDYLPIVDISEAAAASKNKRITIEELMRGMPDGTAAAPSIAFESDLNTGIYSPGADQVAISTNGTGRLFVDASGRVGIGTSSPTFNLVSASNTTDGGWLYSSVSVSTLGLGGYSLAGDGAFQLKYDRSTGDITFNGGSRDTPVERARIDSSGRLLAGTSTSIVEQFGGQAQLQAVTTGSYAIGAFHYSNDVNECVLTLGKSRSVSAGGHTIVQNGDSISSLRFEGSDGTGFLTAAQIAAQVDGTPGTNDMPGRLVFSVTADGAASPTEALRISNDRSITVSDGGNVVLGTTTGTKIGTGTTQKIGFYNATPVVQPTAVADATDAVDVITQLNALLTRMRNLGLIAT
jgi:hypothetical protein